jgi:pimeloyl-ACP methyl ester carboxylesterase
MTRRWCRPHMRSKGPAGALLLVSALSALACGGEKNSSGRTGEMAIPPWPTVPMPSPPPLDGLATNASGPEMEAPDPEVAPSPMTPPDERLAWRFCGALDCSEVVVPLDRRDPEGETIEIAINRVRAGAGYPYRGRVIVNQGGPGLSGKAFVAENWLALRALFPGFDVVAFDPRGVGESAALDCPIEEDPAQTYRSRGVSAVIASLGALAQSCEQATGALFHHLGSQEVVADIESIREALGDDQINFVGISYGARLGALYAQTFPDRIRSLVLDAPMRPVADNVDFVKGQFEATLQAHDDFIAACAEGTLACPEDAEAAFETLMATGVESGLREEQVAYLWSSLLSSSPGRDAAVELLNQPTVLAEIALQPMTAGPAPQINPALNLSVHCADDSLEPPSLEEAESLMAGFAERSERFAPLGVPSLYCAGWQPEPDPVEIQSFEWPALIVGGAADSRTPLAWAIEMAETLRGSALLRSEHYGHSAIGNGGRCVADAVTDYVVDLVLPVAGTVCAAPPSVP